MTIKLKDIFRDIFLVEAKSQRRDFKAPEKVTIPKDGLTIFLAGSIEMGKAEDWQTKVTKLLAEKFSNIYMVNPRRDDWDSSWEQKIENPQFNEQVTWELSNIENSSIVMYYFDKKTQSPITLAELGLAAGKFPEKAIVICPEGYFRKGNVDIICDRYGIEQVETIDELPEALKKKFNKLKEIV
jgi:hypothetical protein